MKKEYWCHQGGCFEQCKTTVSVITGEVNPPTQCLYNSDDSGVEPIWKDHPTTTTEEPSPEEIKICRDEVDKFLRPGRDMIGCRDETFGNKNHCEMCFYIDSKIGCRNFRRVEGLTIIEALT